MEHSYFSFAVFNGSRSSILPSNESEQSSFVDSPPVEY